MKCCSQPADGVIFLMKNSTICWWTVVLQANASKLLQTLFITISTSVLFLLTISIPDMNALFQTNHFWPNLFLSATIPTFEIGV